MYFVPLILIGVLIAGFFSARRSWKQNNSTRERSWLTRVALFTLCGLLFAAALLLPLPNKHRLLVLVPIFFVFSIANRVFKAAHKRVAQAPPDFEKMKRVK
jgi:phosphatidylglycerophosphate synthase